VFSPPSEFTLPRKFGKTGLHENTSLILFFLFSFFYSANDGAGDVNPTSDDFFFINIK